VQKIWQWDCREVVKNGSDSKDLFGDSRYTEKNIQPLIARGATVFMECATLRPFSAKESGRVYREIPYGKLMELYVIDTRSYRGPKSANNQTSPSAETQFFGEEQLTWEKQSLLHSRFT